MTAGEHIVTVAREDKRKQKKGTMCVDRWQKTKEKTQ